MSPPIVTIFLISPPLFSSKAVDGESEGCSLVLPLFCRLYHQSAPRDSNALTRCFLPLLEKEKKKKKMLSAACCVMRSRIHLRSLRSEHIKPDLKTRPGFNKSNPRRGWNGWNYQCLYVFDCNTARNGFSQICTQIYGECFRFLFFLCPDGE